jgi:hypothetical protein
MGKAAHHAFGRGLHLNRLADADVAKAVGDFLMQSADYNVYVFENDARLKAAVAIGK